MNVPQKVYVIKNKMKFYTNVVDDKHCLYSFTNKRTANMCMNFLANYKHRYNEYPPINHENYVPEISMYKKPIQKIISEELQITNETTENMLSMCSWSKLELLVIDSFKYTVTLNNMNIEFTANTITPEEFEDTDNTYCSLYLESLLFDE